MSLDFEQARFSMVNQQVRVWEVLDPRVLDALKTIKREDFIPARYRRMAFADMPIPLEHGQMTMKPVVEGRMLQALELEPEDEVLEIGTGCGFVTACLAQLARDVVSIDIHSDFVERAKARFKTMGLANVRVEVADAFSFNPDRHFDAIAVTGAVMELPANFLSWLKPGGRLFAVHGQGPAQRAVLHRSSAQGRVTVEGLFETELPHLIGAEPVDRFTL